MGRLRPATFVNIPCSGYLRALICLAVGTFKAPAGSTPPDLILGAGHRTHISVLAARRAYGGKAVVLMNPTLSVGLFDCAVIPEHDSPKKSSKIISTLGVLNTVQKSTESSKDRGLILIGGPSKHHGWNDKQFFDQLNGVLKRYPAVEWQVTTSRRTPVETIKCLKQIADHKVDVVTFEETEKNWVRDRLKECRLVWVSEDSVTMVFEALTSGAQVGLLNVPRSKSITSLFGDR